MSSESANTIHIHHHEDDQPTNHPLIFPNVNSIVKLTGSNYQHWKIQIESLLVGYDLFHFVDGSTDPPHPPTITNTPNPAFNTWFRQDKLLFSALIGTLSPSMGPLVTRASSSKEAWDILSTACAPIVPSHRNHNHNHNHVKQLKLKLKNLTKGCTSGDKIFDNGPDPHRSQFDVVHARDNSILSPEELQNNEQVMIVRPTPKQILIGSSKVLALGLLESIGTVAYFCAKLSSRASRKLARGAIKLRKHSLIMGIKIRRGGDDEKKHMHMHDENGLWRKSILMGDKCDPLNFSGVIYYDCNGNMLSEVPVKSPRAAPFTTHA